MMRLPHLRPESLDTSQAEFYESVAHGDPDSGGVGVARIGPDGALEGPFNAMLLSPAIGCAMKSLGNQVRYHSTLTDRCREVAILAVSAHHGSRYERIAHTAIGHRVGLTDREIEAATEGASVAFTDSKESLVLSTTWALLSRADLDDTEYVAGRQLLGDRALFELVVLVGHYASIALQLRVFRAEPAGPSHESLTDAGPTEEWPER